MQRRLRIGPDQVDGGREPRHLREVAAHLVAADKRIQRGLEEPVAHVRHIVHPVRRQTHGGEGVLPVPGDDAEEEGLDIHAFLPEERCDGRNADAAAVDDIVHEDCRPPEGLDGLHLDGQGRVVRVRFDRGGGESGIVDLVRVEGLRHRVRHHGPAEYLSEGDAHHFPELSRRLHLPRDVVQHRDLVHQAVVEHRRRDGDHQVSGIQLRHAVLQVLLGLPDHPEHPLVGGEGLLQGGLHVGEEKQRRVHVRHIERHVLRRFFGPQEALPHHGGNHAVRAVAVVRQENRVVAAVLKGAHDRLGEEQLLRVVDHGILFHVEAGDHQHLARGAPLDHVAEVDVLQDVEQVVRRQVADPRRAHQAVVVHVVAEQQEPVPGLPDGVDQMGLSLFCVKQALLHFL